MNKLTIIGVVALSTAALVGCETTTNTNIKKVNDNTAVVVNNNSNMAMNMNSNMNSSTNKDISRAEYDKDRAKYEANKGASTIGQGANDSWIWFKTKSALATTNELRDSTINVDVSNDVITLKGSVASAAEKTKAEEVAKGIDGQKGVKNELKVDAKDSMTNQMTTTNSSNSNMKSKSDK